MAAFRWSLVFLFGGAPIALAQRTSLEMRPRMGDTLRMRLDQTSEMSITRSGTPPRQVITRTHMLSRAIVEREVPDGVYVLAVTDSVDVSSTDPSAARSVDAMRRQLAGRQMRLRISPDGTVAMAEPSGPDSKAVNDLVSVMPASFPRDPVNVGDTWTREMPIAPSAAARLPGANGRGGVARATFRLDSLARQGELAYVSMRGTLEPQPNDPRLLAVGVVLPPLGGTVSGSMVVNRRRGWLSESRFVVDLHTTIAATKASSAPTEIRMRVTQQMRVFGKSAAR
jgi:hypothetical protein